MTDNQLTESWDKVFQASQQAIDWVNDVRPNVARLNNEADGLILELRRLRNTAKRLGAVSSKPITAGFFGLSQAGKSFLISALAADQKGNLETTANSWISLNISILLVAEKKQRVWLLVLLAQQKRLFQAIL